MNSLWYTEEARVWEEALPLGNGRMGAMVFSGMAAEKLALNDDTLWAGHPQRHTRQGAEAKYKEARNLAMAGKYKEAQEIIEEFLLGKHSQRYLPMGDLLLEMGAPAAAVTAYRRELNLENAIHTLTYTLADGSEFTRETFIAHKPEPVLVMRLSTNKQLNFTAKFACQLHHTTTAAGHELVLDGIGDGHDAKDPAKQGIRFAAIANFAVTNGIISQENDSLRIQNATEVIIRLTCRTNFADSFTPPGLAGVPYRQDAEKDMERALRFSFAALKAGHITDYQSLYNRLDINFGAAPNLPTTERLAGWRTAENDPALFALLFQYGRYLMIAGSRPGSQPLNLQGIWNPLYEPPWRSNYTLNINTEMNYWPAEAANLAECHQPLFDLLRRLRITGGETAKIHFGASGYLVNHNTDIWAMTTPSESWAKGTARWAFWPLAAGWLSTHAFSHYLYNLDDNFLEKTAFPLIKDAARFFLDVMVEDTDGTLIFAPSTSPENDFLHADGKYAVSKTTTMTVAIIKETLENAVACCDILELYPEFRAEAMAALMRMPAYQIGPRGELLEWSEDLPEAEPTHRHTSHLYPLFPGNDIAAGTPLADACAKTLELRGEESTGWALAWRICLYARLLDGERAFSFLKKQVRPCEGRHGGCYPNMFGAHPPFQIDSNFGATAGMAEMLLQNPRRGVIHLLPALPKALDTGYVKGLRAKGGVTVNMWFEKGKVTRAELTLDAHLSDKVFTVICDGEHVEVKLKAGKTAVIE